MSAWDDREHPAMQEVRDLKKALAAERGRCETEIERLRAALENITKDPPATLNEPDSNVEVIVKMRAIARAALDEKKPAAGIAPGPVK
jgi:hypothetical protein